MDASFGATKRSAPSGASSSRRRVSSLSSVLLSTENSPERRRSQVSLFSSTPVKLTKTPSSNIQSPVVSQLPVPGTPSREDSPAARMHVRVPHISPSDSHSTPAASVPFTRLLFKDALQNNVPKREGESSRPFGLQNPSSPSRLAAAPSPSNTKQKMRPQRRSVTLTTKVSESPYGECTKREGNHLSSMEKSSSSTLQVPSLRLLKRRESGESSNSLSFIERHEDWKTIEKKRKEEVTAITPSLGNKNRDEKERLVIEPPKKAPRPPAQRTFQPAPTHPVPPTLRAPITTVSKSTGRSVSTPSWTRSFSTKSSARSTSTRSGATTRATSSRTVPSIVVSRNSNTLTEVGSSRSSSSTSMSSSAPSSSSISSSSTTSIHLATSSRKSTTSKRSSTFSSSSMSSRGSHVLPSSATPSGAIKVLCTEEVTNKPVAKASKKDDQKTEVQVEEEAKEELEEGDEEEEEEKVFDTTGHSPITARLRFRIQYDQALQRREWNKRNYPSKKHLRSLLEVQRRRRKDLSSRSGSSSSCGSSPEWSTIDSESSLISSQPRDRSAPPTELHVDPRFEGKLALDLSESNRPSELFRREIAKTPRPFSLQLSPLDFNFVEQKKVGELPIASEPVEGDTQKVDGNQADILTPQAPSPIQREEKKEKLKGSNVPHSVPTTTPTKQKRMDGVVARREGETAASPPSGPYLRTKPLLAGKEGGKGSSAVGLATGSQKKEKDEPQVKPTTSTTSNRVEANEGVELVGVARPSQRERPRDPTRSSSSLARRALAKETASTSTKATSVTVMEEYGKPSLLSSAPLLQSSSVSSFTTGSSSSFSAATTSSVTTAVTTTGILTSKVEEMKKRKLPFVGTLVPPPTSATPSSASFPETAGTRRAKPAGPTMTSTTSTSSSTVDSSLTTGASLLTTPFRRKSMVPTAMGSTAPTPTRAKKTLPPSPASSATAMPTGGTRTSFLFSPSFPPSNRSTGTPSFSNPPSYSSTFLASAGRRLTRGGDEATTRPPVFLIPELASPEELGHTVTIVFDLDETLVNNRGIGNPVFRPHAITVLKQLRERYPRPRYRARTPLDGLERMPNGSPRGFRGKGGGTVGTTAPVGDLRSAMDLPTPSLSSSKAKKVDDPFGTIARDGETASNGHGKNEGAIEEDMALPLGTTGIMAEAPGEVESVKKEEEAEGEDATGKEVEIRVELILWTASVESLARIVLHKLDPQGHLFDFAIFRDPIWYRDTINYTKRLQQLGRRMDRVVIIENSPASVRTNRENAILVTDYIRGHSDTELLVVSKILHWWIATVRDAIDKMQKKEAKDREQEEGEIAIPEEVGLNPLVSEAVVEGPTHEDGLVATLDDAVASMTSMTASPSPLAMERHAASPAGPFTTTTAVSHAEESGTEGLTGDAAAVKAPPVESHGEEPAEVSSSLPPPSVFSMGSGEAMDGAMSTTPLKISDVEQEKETAATGVMNKDVDPTTSGGCTLDGVEEDSESTSTSKTSMHPMRGSKNRLGLPTQLSADALCLLNEKEIGCNSPLRSDMNARVQETTTPASSPLFMAHIQANSTEGLPSVLYSSHTESMEKESTVDLTREAGNGDFEPEMSVPPTASSCPFKHECRVEDGMEDLHGASHSSSFSLKSGILWPETECLDDIRVFLSKHPNVSRQSHYVITSPGRRSKRLHDEDSSPRGSEMGVKGLNRKGVEGVGGDERDGKGKEASGPAWKRLYKLAEKPTPAGTEAKGTGDGVEKPSSPSSDESSSSLVPSRKKKKKTKEKPGDMKGKSMLAKRIVRERKRRAAIASFATTDSSLSTVSGASSSCVSVAVGTLPKGKYALVELQKEAKGK